MGHRSALPKSCGDLAAVSAMALPATYAQRQVHNDCRDHDDKRSTVLSPDFECVLQFEREPSSKLMTVTFGLVATGLPSCKTSCRIPSNEDCIAPPVLLVRYTASSTPPTKQLCFDDAAPLREEFGQHGRRCHHLGQRFLLRFLSLPSPAGLSGSGVTGPGPVTAKLCKMAICAKSQVYQ